MDGKTQDLNQSLALTGTIKAVRSAVVKARVAGELRGSGGARG